MTESLIREYYELLGGNEEQQRRAWDLKRAHFPWALYRYRSVARLGRCLEELRGNYLFLSISG
jgi:hypothetical protein